MIVCWNTRSLIPIDYLQKGRIVYVDKYADLLDRLTTIWKTNDRN